MGWLTAYRKQLYIALALIPIAVGALGFFALLKSPYTGIKFESRDGKWYVASVRPGSPAAAQPKIIGKEVVAIVDFRLGEYDLFGEWGRIPDNGSFKHFWEAQRYFDGHVKIGVPLAITFNSSNMLRQAQHEREITARPEPFAPTVRPELVEGERLAQDMLVEGQSTVQIIPSAFPLYHLVSKVWANFSVSVVALLMGLIVALKRPDDKKALLYLLFSVFGSLVIFTSQSPASRDIALDIRVFHFMGFANLFAVIFGSAVFLHLCLVFPSEKRMIFRNLPTVLYVLSAVILLSSFFASLFHSWKVANIFSLLCVISGLAAMIHSYMTIRSADERAQAKWVIYGTGLFFVMYMAILVRGIFYGPNDALELFIGFAFILIPLSMSLAILKYRLMDIDTLFDNTLIYSVTLGLLVLLDMAVITALIKVGVLDFPRSNPFVAVSILVWTVIFAYLPIRNFVQRRIKRLLKREVYDANQAALELSRELLSATDVPSAVKKTVDAINNTLHPKGGEAYLDNENLTPPDLPFTKGEEYYSPSLLKRGRGGVEFKNITDPTHLFSLIPSEDLPKGYSGGVLVPIIGSTGRLGYIILQDKHSERLYDREDMKLLGIMASQAAMCIEAVRHREEAERKEKEAKAAKERITRDIHDGISSEFSGIMAYSERMKGLLDVGADSGDIKEMLGNIEASSHRGVRELRNIISAIGSEERTLGFATAYVKRFSRDLLNSKGIDVTFKDETDGEAALPASVLINIIRLSQEACHNIIKHAGASRVNIAFSKDGDLLILEIEDDGKGFDFDAATTNGGHGLRNMEKRVKEVGGEIAFTSSPGKGTVIKVGFPLA